MTKWLLLLGAFALAAGMTFRMVLSAHSAAARPAPLASRSGASAQPPLAAGEGRLRWTALWTHAVPDLKAMALSDDGATVAWVDKRGAVRRLAGATGQTLWETGPSAGVNATAAGPNGTVLAYSQLNPMDTSVRIFSGGNAAEPPHVAQAAVDGAIWTVTVDTAQERALVGTGKYLLFSLPLKTAAGAETPASGAPERIAVQGIPTSLADSAVVVTVPTPMESPATSAPAAGGARAGGVPAVFAGTWQDAGVCAWNAAGAPLWRHDDPRPDRSFEVRLSTDGATAVAISSRQPRGQDARLHVWDGRSGRLIWSEILEAGDAHALVSEHGDFIAVSYARPSGEFAADGTPILLHKVALLDRFGHRLFSDMGGIFFAPELVALSEGAGRTARVTVRDMSGSLWTIDERGRILSRLRPPVNPKTGASPTIRRTLSTPDGTYLLLLRGSGDMTLYKASAS